MTIKNYSLILIILIFLSFSSYSQGYLQYENTETLEDIGGYSKEGFGFAEDIPIKKSLEMYVPPIGSQRETGSCVAWATTYYNLSIIYNMTFGITSYKDKVSHSFDPWYTYSMVNRNSNNSSNCNKGLYYDDAMSFLENVGPKKFLFPPYDMACNLNISSRNLKSMNRYTNPYRISKFEAEQAYNFDPYNYPLSNEVINKIKTEIGKYSYPVVVGFRNYGSSTLDNVGSSGYWYPKYYKAGGHMMTVVGYDDTLNGGSFRLVNSWGYDWGDNGYAWIRYSDFKRFCDIAIFTWLKDNIQSEFKQIKNLTNYTRSYANDETRIFEGEQDTNGYTGYGIVSYLKNDNHYAGWFVNGRKEGIFRVIDSNGFWQIEYKNGEMVDYSKLGFAKIQEGAEELERTNNYFKRMFPSIRFKEFTDNFEEEKNTVIE